MIVKLHKYLIFGHKDSLERFFALAQRAGFLEFLGVSHKKALELPETAKSLLLAIKIAKRHPVRPEEAPEFFDSPPAIAEKLIAFNTEHEQLLEEMRLLRTEISRIAIFGDFSREELDHLEAESKRTIQFFCMKSAVAKDTPLPPEVIFVGTEYDLDYFVAINRETVQYPKMFEIQIERPVGILRARLEEVKQRLALVEGQIRLLSHTLPKLQNGLTEYLNEYHLELAKHDAALSLNEALFAIEAWVPDTKVKSLYGLLSGLNVECEEIAIESRDQVPTCIENKGASKIGEDLVNVYDTPAHTDRDPSLWVLIFFSLFFAMIISDAGYGLIFLICGLYFRWKTGKSSAQLKRFAKLVLILATTCIVWGIGTASYFGIELAPESPLRKTSFISYLVVKKAQYHLEVKDDVYDEYVKNFPSIAAAKNGQEFLDLAVKTEQGKIQYKALDNFSDNLLMECSFLIGILHISLSFLRYLFRNWSGLGWIIFMIGGYLFFPSIVMATTSLNFLGIISKPVAHSVGLQLVIVGISVAFIAALIKKKWGAFHELLNVVQVFADVISYLRLYALALGGMVMAHTFNDHLGIDVGIIGAAIIILLGHANNISLCIMGGVIHGLRLNFLEWYHYSFEGGGRLFNPLRLKKIK